MTTPKDFKSSRLANVPLATVWSEFTPLAQKHNAVNLGQGFPSFAPEQFVKDSLTDVVENGDALSHQYSKTVGAPEVSKLITDHYSAKWDFKITPEQFAICNGATQGLNATFQTILSPDDEVIVFEPFFDCYVNDIEMAHGKAVVVPLTPCDVSASNWAFDPEVLRKAVTNKTKAILINTPMNIPGKVFSLSELQVIADIATQHDLLVLSDEVYENITFDGHKHIPIATLPGMFERTLTMLSAGKTFSCTGWKIGWVFGPERLINALGQTLSFQTFCVATPLKLAIARSYKQAESNGFYERFSAMYNTKRTMLLDGLDKAGLRPITPQGSFFVLANIDDIDRKLYMDPAETNVARDWQFCRWLTKEIGVGAIPVTAFCRPSSRPQLEKYVRFAFCKTDEAILEGSKRMLQLRKFIPRR
jgi:kynurenine---oxoglutarate transaminase / cysteine-S-conjugate beta-lyase / glutamine---phenylpyruvate transaminase